MADYLSYLERKLKRVPKEVDVEQKYRKNFEKFAQYMGNGVYSWKGLTSSDPRELFIIGVLHCEKIRFKER